MRITDFSFDLPQELIARYPTPKRSGSRLLCLSGENGYISHRQFLDVIDLIDEGDLLVFNDTRVIPARLHGQKSSGGQIEVLVERVLSEHRILAQVRASKAPRVGDYLLFNKLVQLEVANRVGKFFELRYNGSHSILDLIESIGEIPLPPYMHRSPEESDKERYQTIYARHKGSVAAPTAGFHFDDAVLQQLNEKKVQMDYLTLHIGAGTFTPVRAEDIREHKMHAEYLNVSQDLCDKIKETKARGKRVIAIGTTSMRALETACQGGEIAPYQGETSIFIYPGYEFRCVDALVTNLHLPASSLLILVCAFSGREHVLHAYKEAVEMRYRFYSYGDAMWVTKS